MGRKKNVALDREAWARRALDVLRIEGIQGVRVERLARDLGVTKGSFYWHFKDRNALYRNMLDYWADAYTQVVVGNTEFHDDDPGGSLMAAMKMVRRDGLDQYEMAIRAWADRDRMAEQAVRRVDRQRTSFVRGLFERLAVQGQDAEIRTRLLLC